MKQLIFLLSVVILFTSCNPTATAVKNSEKAIAPIESASEVLSVTQRSDVEEKYQWNLKDIYKTPEAWEADFTIVSGKMDELESFKGKVSQSGEAIAEYFALSELLNRKIGTLYLYAGLKKDEDTRISENQGRMTRIAALNNKVNEKCSFFQTELLTVPVKTLKKYFSSVEGLKDYTFWLQDLLRQQDHVLTDKEESLLAMLGNFSNTPDNIQEAIKYADMKFPNVEDGDGNMIQLTPGRYYQLLLDPNPDVRRRAFEARNGAFDKVINTSAATYNAQLQKDLFYTKARGYNSSLERSLSHDNIPLEIFNNLIQTVTSNL